MTNKLNDIPTILVIDDEPAARLALDGLLANAGFNLFFAPEGYTGLEMATNLLPDAIILDIMMPGMDGYEVCRRLRLDPELAETHIIMLTALGDREARLAGLTAGADDFISKPYDSLELQLRLKSVLHTNRYRRLLAERARFAWLVESSETGYLLLNQRAEIQYANASARLLLRLSHNPEGISLPRHIEQYYQPQPHETWDDWLANPAPCYLIQPETPSARAVWLLLDALDAPFGVASSRVVRVSDVTQQISLEHDMRRFHTIVSHKLRTPVALLYTSMAYVENRLESMPIEDLRSFVSTAWKSTKRLADTVRDIINYIDAPRRQQPDLFTELEKVEEVALMIQQRSKLKPISVRLPEELRHTAINLNSSTLEILLQEIIENAQKFHPQHNPSIEIEVKSAGSCKAWISVQDDGLTLTAQQLKWAVQPYFQGEKYFTGEVEGIGLGLPTAATMLWQVGGDLHIGNRDDQPGIRVDISLPIQQV